MKSLIQRTASRRAVMQGIAGAMLLTLAIGNSFAQRKRRQVGNADYRFDNKSPAYDPADGPRITVHRYVSPYVQRDSFDPFGPLARSDGFKMNWLDKPISSEALEQTDILILANAYTNSGANNFRNFTTLDAPSVYSEQEIELIRDWVEGGGSLLILADHSPFAGGTIKLAAAFGYTFMTGFAIHRDSKVDGILTDIRFFRNGGSDKQDGRLAQHPITDGSLGRAEINMFFAFGGQAIIPPAEATNLLTIPTGFETLLTFAIRRQFDSAPRMDSSGFSQGAVSEFGKGRVAVFGETGAFTSQILDETFTIGLGAPEAPENEEFILSTLRWLARYEP